MRMLVRILIIIVSAAVLLLAVGWVGLQVKANPFPKVVSDPNPTLIPIPTDLPAPVLRFAQALFGDEMPVVRSAMVLGRAQLAPTGMPMPTRFRFYYDVARSSHYHDIQVTWFTAPFMRIHERNLEGHTQLDLAVIGQVNDQPKTNRAAIQGYWAETLAWMPAIVLADSQVRWEAIDETSARLMLPDLDDIEAFTVRFDAETGLMTEVETMRYQDESHPERWRWFNRILEWGEVDGMRVAVRSQTQWNDAAPWATWEVEQAALNVDVSARLAQFGSDVP